MWTNLGALVRYRGLIRSLVARELKARYRGSVLGFFCSFVNPLLLLSIYSFVFTEILENRDDVQPYSLFMFCGLLPWTWFSSSLNEASGALISGSNLIRKVLFPAEVLPIVSVLANMVHFFFGLLILAAFFVGLQYTPEWGDLVWFPLIVLIQLVFTTGLALALSALTVHFRDIRDLLSNLLTFWFFATPIIYTYTMPSVQDYRWLFNINPFFHLSVSYQEVLFFRGPSHAERIAQNLPPVPTILTVPSPFIEGHLFLLLVFGVISVLVFFAGYWLFDRLRDSFAEAV
jgi:ABC-type polysaccharide/polyol phosphate export permease